MRPIRTVSVLMPTWQGEEFLERVLAALAAQDCAIAWDFRAIDSGSPPPAPPRPLMRSALAFACGIPSG